MPNIKPISDLRNYSEVLHDVAVGAPVFLTKNGRGRYAIVDMHDYEKTQATLRLMNELAKGRKSSEEKGWLILSPILAGVSAWLMCAAQNAANVLQAEQSSWNKYNHGTESCMNPPGDYEMQKDIIYIV